MNWTHVKLIFEREVRDQLRDRRTMFTIFFLPLLLYPLMGMVMFEVAQFHKQEDVVIGVVNADKLPANHPVDRVQRRIHSMEEVDRDAQLDHFLESTSNFSQESNQREKRNIPSRLNKLLNSMKSICSCMFPKQLLTKIGFPRSRSSAIRDGSGPS